MRTRTALAACGLAAAVLTGGAGTASALGNDQDATTVNGNGATQAYGNTSTGGQLSPQLGLVQGSLNKLCLGVPAKVNAGSLIGAVPITVQDVNVLADPQNQQCAEDSTQAKGDEALSHILDDIPVLSGNGSADG
ncbi:rodlin [Actinacidiphila acidipaludis]|uniref:RdlA protein n=1 Tax=Actinacidiphila acidipaludis TaxID=2873382 RepID=A0ABS7Q8L7_9ACTN|nr:rodlin [Streptomyces acidipaludis]MBY8878372.1 RdlA protein [Streptomyces acidipaludis]